MKEPPGRSADTYCTGSRQDSTRPGELSLERSPSLARAEAVEKAGESLPGWGAETKRGCEKKYKTLGLSTWL